MRVGLLTSGERLTVVMRFFEDAAPNYYLFIPHQHPCGHPLEAFQVLDVLFKMGTISRGSVFFSIISKKVRQMLWMITPKSI